MTTLTWLMSLLWWSMVLAVLSWLYALLLRSHVLWSRFSWRTALFVCIHPSFLLREGCTLDKSLTVIGLSCQRNTSFVGRWMTLTSVHRHFISNLMEHARICQEEWKACRDLSGLKAVIAATGLRQRKSMNTFLNYTLGQAFLTMCFHFIIMG